MATCDTLLIMGGGVMGQGMARLFSKAGMRVTLVEPRDIAFAHPGVVVARDAPAVHAARPAVQHPLSTALSALTVSALLAVFG